MSIIDAITDIGREHARAARHACGAIDFCAEVDEEAMTDIRHALSAAGDPRADMPSLGYAKEARDVMKAFAAGWDEIAAAHPNA